jgi:hypothetical protein
VRDADAALRSQPAPTDAQEADEFVGFWASGTIAEGIFSCVQCGQGVVSLSALPQCPRCDGTLWERPSTSPFDPALSDLSPPAAEDEKWAAEESESTAHFFRGVLIALAAGGLFWLFLSAAAWALLR